MLLGLNFQLDRSNHEPSLFLKPLYSVGGRVIVLSCSQSSNTVDTHEAHAAQQHLGMEGGTLASEGNGKIREQLKNPLVMPGI